MMEKCYAFEILVDIKYPGMFQKKRYQIKSKYRETELEFQGFFERNEGLFILFLNHMPAPYVKRLSNKIPIKLLMGQNRENG